MFTNGPAQTIRGHKLLFIAFIILCAALAIAAGVLILYHGIRYRLIIELGQPIPPASAFLTDGKEATYVKPPAIDPYHEGEYPLKILTGGVQRRVVLELRDTTPPAAENANLTLLPGERPEPSDVLKNVTDASLLKIAWERYPELDSAGLHACAVRLTDEHGNTTVVEATVQIAAVVDVLHCEIGSARPSPSDFFVGWEKPVSFVTDLSGVDWMHPATVPVTLSSEGRQFKSEILLTDELPEELRLQSVAVRPGDGVRAADLVRMPSDRKSARYSFANEPDLSACGLHTVTVAVTDDRGETKWVAGSILVCEAFLRLEAGDAPIAVSELTARLGEEYRDYFSQELSAYVPDKMGADLLTLTDQDGKKLALGLLIEDTTPPLVKTAERVCYMGYPYEPAYFIEEIIDASDVQAEFFPEPDWDQVGTVPISLRVRDDKGNQTLTKTAASFVRDTKAPSIVGAKDRYCYVGDPVVYYQGVVAQDNADPDCALTVDHSAVNPREAGTYPVIYKAADRDGNTSSVAVRFYFSNRTVSDEELDALAEQIFSEILTDQMSLYEQAEAVFQYLRENIAYSGYSDKTDWMKNIYQGLRQHRGDCYTTSYAAKFLLEKLGAETVLVQRDATESRHFWLLVNLGNGWYHFDAGNTSPQNYYAFMKTTEELSAVRGGQYYWKINPDLYPAVAETPCIPF